MKNHAELLLATPSMCQSRDLLIHVLRYDNNICVCVSTKTSPLLNAKAPLYLPLVLEALEKDTRIHIPVPSLLKVKPFGGVSDFSDLHILGFVSQL